MGNTLYKDYDIQSPPIATGGVGYIWRIHAAVRKSDKVPVSVWLFDKKAAISTEKSGNSSVISAPTSQNPSHEVPPLPVSLGPSPNPITPLHKSAINPIVARLKRGAQWLKLLNQHGEHENLLKIIVPFEDTKQCCYMVTEPVLCSLGNIMGRGGVDYHWKQYVKPGSPPEIIPSSFITDKYPTSLTHGGEFDQDEKLKVMKDVASLLSHLHKTIRIVHGNISPENIFFSPSGQVRVGGFIFSQPHDVSDLTEKTVVKVTNDVIPQNVTPTKRQPPVLHPAVVQSTKSNSHQIDLPIIFQDSPGLPLYSIHISSPDKNPLKGVKKSIGPAVSSSIQRVLLQPNLAYLPPELVTRGNLSTITPGGRSLDPNEVASLIKSGSNFSLSTKDSSRGDLCWIPAPSADIYSFGRLCQDLWLWVRDDIINYDFSKYHSFNPIQILETNTCPKGREQDNITSSNKRIPAAISSILRYLLAPTRVLPSSSVKKNPKSYSANVARPSDISPLFQSSIFSKNKILKAIEFADHISSKSPQDTASFFLKFPTLLESIPFRFLIHRILPPLCFTLNRYTNTIIKRYVGIFLWITDELASDRWVHSELWKSLWVRSIFSKYLLPGLVPIFDRREPSVLKLLVDYYPVLYARMPEKSIDYLFPFIVDALFSKEFPLVESVLLISPTLITNLHKHSTSTFLEYCKSLYSLVLQCPQESLAIRTLGLINSRIIPLLTNIHHVTSSLVPTLRFLLCADHFVHLPWLNQQAVKSKDVLSSRNQKYSDKTKTRPVPPTPTSGSATGSDTTEPNSNPDSNTADSLSKSKSGKTLFNPALGIPPGFPHPKASPTLVIAVVATCFAISNKFEDSLNSASLFLPWLFPLLTTPNFSQTQKNYFQSVLTIMTNRVYTKLGLSPIQIVGCAPDLSTSSAPQYYDEHFILGQQQSLPDRELEAWLGSLTPEETESEPDQPSEPDFNDPHSTPAKTKANKEQNRPKPNFNTNIQSPHSSRPLPSLKTDTSGPASTAFQDITIPPRNSIYNNGNSNNSASQSSQSPVIPPKRFHSVEEDLFGAVSPEIPRKTSSRNITPLSNTYMEHDISSYDPIGSNFNNLSSSPNYGGGLNGLNITMATPGGTKAPLDLGFLSDMTPADNHDPGIDFSSDMPHFGDEGLDSYSTFGSDPNDNSEIGQFDPLEYSHRDSNSFTNPYM